MKKEPLFIAFSTQKGGAGKTTLTVLMASYLYYVKGYDVVVVDCDFPQFSIKDMRERDLKNIERNPYLRKLAYDQFKRIGKRAYPIVGSRPDNAIETVKPFIESATPPDFIFFDLTGTVNNPRINQDGGDHGLHFLSYSRRPIHHGKFAEVCKHYQ